MSHTNITLSNNIRLFEGKKIEVVYVNNDNTCFEFGNYLQFNNSNVIHSILTKSIYILG